MTHLGRFFIMMIALTVLVSVSAICLETLRRKIIHNYMIHIGFSYRCIGTDVDKYGVTRPRYKYIRNLTCIDEDNLMSYPLSDIKKLYRI